MKRIDWIFVFLIWINFISVHAQEENKTLNVNELNFELLGAGGIYSINYNRHYQIANWELSGRIGISSVHLQNPKRKFDPSVAIPLGIILTRLKKFGPYISMGLVYYSGVQMNFNGTHRYHELNGFGSVGVKYDLFEKNNVRLKATFDPIWEQFNSFRATWSFAIGYLW